MALFKRKSQDTDSVPQEVQDYYQAEKRDRSGMAWLMAIGTLLITIAIALGLFFAGRWGYRAIFNNDDEANIPAVSESENTGIGELPGASTTVDEEPANTSDDPSNSDTEQTDTQTTITPGTTGSNTSTSSNNGSTDENAAEQTGKAPLPDTGPGDTLAIFIAMTFVASLLYYRLVPNPKNQ